MTDKDIIKALECCIKEEYSCKDCPYDSDKHFNKKTLEFATMQNGMSYDQLSCDEWMKIDALDLINRQKAENEALINGQETLLKYIAEQKAEIERLQKAGEEAVSCFNRMESLYNIKCMELKVAKNQAITEFAERLKEDISNHRAEMFMNGLKGTPRMQEITYECVEEYIDQIAKELKEGVNNA